MSLHASSSTRVRCVTAFAIAAFGAASSGVAQALKNERHVLARRLALRAELLDACVGAGPEARQAATAACNAISRADPLVPLARALLAARGVDGDLDAAAEFRAGLFAIVTPEVVDLDRFEEVFVTLLATRKVVLPGEVRVLCTLRDAAGYALRDTIRSGAPTIDEFLRASVRAPIPMVELPEGLYSVEVVSFVDGEAPADDAPRFAVPVQVRGDFKQRALAQPLPFTPFHGNYTGRNVEVAGMLDALGKRLLDPDGRALWRGALRRVDRAFRGEPRLPGVDPLLDLERLERILSDVEAGRDPLDAYRGVGRRTIGLAVAAPDADTATLIETEIVQVSVDLPAVDVANPPTPKPLVVVMPGQPTWDGLADRPTSKWVEQPEWLVHELQRAGFDAAGAVHLAILESPGKLRSPTQVLVAATRRLLELLPVEPGRVVWVGERDGAYCVTRALLLAPGLASRAVLVNGGFFSNPELDRLGQSPDAVELLAIGSQGHPSEPTLRGLVDRAEGRCSARWLPGESTRPWPVALPLSAEAVRAFATQRDD